MSDLLERLRLRDWRITPQRRAVAQVLTGRNTHLSADQVYERARTVVPEISLATVYNTLRELTSMGEITEIKAGGGAVRFDPNVDVRHHHLVCLGCGKLLDVFPTGEVGLHLGEAHGYEVTGLSITFEGRCPACSA